MGTRDAFVGTSFGSVVGLSDCFRGGEAKITNSEILQFVLKKDLVLSKIIDKNRELWRKRF